ncbi:ABC transporter permease [archaeon]|nr:ABC transporter permease [archaeon]
MKIKKSVQLAGNMLTHSKLRSWLTIIGIIIGIASVIAIIGMSQGAQKNLEDQLSGLGADIVTITPGFSKATGFRMPRPDEMGGASTTSDQDPLTNKDVIVLKSISNVKYVMGSISQSLELKYDGDTIDKQVTGVETDTWKEITTEELSEGRFLTKGDSYSVVLGERVAEETFEGVEINRKIQIEGKSFKVVGILANSNSIYIPIEVARNLMDDFELKEYSSISVKLENSEDSELFDTTLTEIKEKLMMHRGILKEEDRDFTISDMKSMQETMSETMGTMSFFLGAIAAISLLVGAIGIANTMFTSVLEKTKEIGIMKAIGAKNKDIMKIFLINSGMIGFVGGIGGAILGYFLSSALSSYTSSSAGGMASRMFGSSSISLGLVLTMLIFSILIGMIAGAIPAYRASKLKPVDALRYE